MGCINDKHATSVDNQVSPNEKGNNKLINSYLVDDEKKDQDVRKLLLLGAGESGKSTLFRQARTLFGEGFGTEDRMDYVNTIAGNVVENLQILIERTDEKEISEAPADVQEALEKIKAVKLVDVAVITPEMGNWVEKIWTWKPIQATYDRRAEFQCIDSIKYYCENIKRISDRDYLPTLQDILMSRRVTLGVTEMEINYKNKKLKMVDVGGQRNQRSKWLHQFSKCSGVIYVAAISEYDQTLREDEQTNRLSEAILLFHTVCNERNLRNLSLILFLNKSDLFRDKLCTRKIPFPPEIFPDYDKGFEFDAACKYLSKKFEAGNQNPHRDIYTHVTCATDTDNIRKVMTDLTDILIQNGLAYLGIITN